MRKLIAGMVSALLVASAAEAQVLTVKRNIVFHTIGKRELKLNLHLPETAGPHPVALVIHGGGWRRGSRGSMNAVALARLLARDGIAGASIDYRHAPKSPHPAQIEDCRRAMQWLRANAKRLDLDGNRVMACGTSAGGHLAGLLGAEKDRAVPDSADPIARQRTRPDMVLSFFGPMDLAANEEGANPWGIRLVQQFLGVTDRSEKSLEIARKASPLHQLAPGAPPFLFVHGTRDTLVPISQSRVMAKALKKMGVPNLLLEVPGSHGDFTYRLAGSKPGEEPEYWQKARGFIKKHWLKPEAREKPRTPRAP